jgi:hypothetical protein
VNTRLPDSSARLVIGELVMKWQGSQAPAEMCLTPTLVFLGPDLVEPPVVEERGHVERVAAREGEVAAEDGHLGRPRHAVVVGLHGVDRAALHRLEELVRGHELVGVVEVDLHLVAGDGVEHVDRGLGHLRAEARAGIGLQAPADRRLRADHVRRGKRRGATQRPGGQELPSRAHGSSPCCYLTFSA